MTLGTGSAHDDDMAKKEWHIPAIDLLGRDVVMSRLRSLGYTGDLDNTLASWVKRRKVPYRIRLQLLEMAKESDIAIEPDDCNVRKCRQECHSVVAAA